MISLIGQIQSSDKIAVPALHVPVAIILLQTVYVIGV